MSDESSNWISLGGADAPSASLIVAAKVTGPDELSALTNPKTATCRLTSDRQRHNKFSIIYIMRHLRFYILSFLTIGLDKD